MIRAIGARELSLKSKHIGLNRVLDIQEELRLMDTSLLEQPEAVPGTGLKRGACWLSLAWLEYLSLPVEKMVPPEWVKDPPLGYQAISDYWHGYYEKSAYEFHRANNFSALFDGGNPDVYALPLTEVVPCIESLQLMYERTGEERYLRELDVLEEYVLQNHWDTPDNRKFNGDYGFLVQGCVETSRGESCYFNTKLLNDNAYLAYLFSKNKDKVYTLKKKPAAVYYPEPVQDPNYPQKRAEEPKPPQAPAKRGAPKAYVAYALAFIAAAAALAHVLRSRSVRAPKSRSNPKTERGGKG